MSDVIASVEAVGEARPVELAADLLDDLLVDRARTGGLTTSTRSAADRTPLRPWEHHRSWATVRSIPVAARAIGPLSTPVRLRDLVLVACGRGLRWWVRGSRFVSVGAGRQAASCTGWAEQSRPG
ncbi:hypothetical protein GCM10023235_11490 [Kitasatospora terrestris]|uniref:Uncharacterized protein n=1 Tax=Kitasatospora terrestris TaxID=258051 RepID=A0ABP9DDM5_9ACTN